MRMSPVRAAALLLAVAATPAFAQEPSAADASQDPRAARGAELASAWCARCHATGLPGQASAVAGPPSFAAIAARPGFDVTMLAKAILAPHPVMPEFPASNADLKALEAYMLTTAGK